MRYSKTLFLAALAGAFGLAVAAESPVWAATTSLLPRGALIRLPDGAVASLPVDRAASDRQPPLVVLLHGAGQRPEEMIALIENDAACADAVLLAPKSKGVTWDVVAMAESRALAADSLSSDVLRYSSSADADRVMSAIDALRSNVSTDPLHQMLLGFSDGATFALALGTGRDRPFTSVVALSPGLAVAPARAARRRPVLIMHGRRDKSTPFEFTQNTVVPALRDAGVIVKFVPFSGGHEIPDGPIETFERQYPDKVDSP
jgi:phospholipase/carboxylesterase